MVDDDPLEQNITTISASSDDPPITLDEHDEPQSTSSSPELITPNLLFEPELQLNECNVLIDVPTKPSELFQFQQQLQLRYLLADGNVAPTSQQLENLTTTMCDEGIYKCPKCVYTTLDITMFRKHLNSHISPKDRQCPFCPYSSSRNDNLKTHIRRHTGERPFACICCGRGFPSKSDLTLHLKTHTGERPYRCGFCDYRGVRRIDVKVHCRKKHDGQENVIFVPKKWAASTSL